MSTANPHASLRRTGWIVDIPPGHLGPMVLPGTQRTIWWTGRVAIGLRYERPTDDRAAVDRDDQQSTTPRSVDA